MLLGTMQAILAREGRLDWRAVAANPAAVNVPYEKAVAA